MKKEIKRATESVEEIDQENQVEEESLIRLKQLWNFTMNNVKKWCEKNHSSHTKTVNDIIKPNKKFSHH